jgi:hypothetical protein
MLTLLNKGLKYLRSNGIRSTFIKIIDKLIHKNRANSCSVQ